MTARFVPALDADLTRNTSGGWGVVSAGSLGGPGTRNCRLRHEIRTETFPGLRPRHPGGDAGRGVRASSLLSALGLSATAAQLRAAERLCASGGPGGTGLSSGAARPAAGADRPL